MEAPKKIYVHVKRNKVTNTCNSTFIGVNDIENVALYEKYCSCGYKAQAYLSTSNAGDIAGFRRNTTIICPCCKRKIEI
jgi:hypothetical protein